MEIDVRDSYGGAIVRFSDNGYLGIGSEEALTIQDSSLGDSHDGIIVDYKDVDNFIKALRTAKDLITLDRFINS